MKDFWGMRTTLHDVAKAAGVSIKTVSNVIHNHPNVTPKTKEKVEAAISALNYSPNLNARSLRTGKTNVIGLAIPELLNSYFTELANYVILAAEEKGLTVVIEQTRGDRDKELKVLDHAERNLVDGMIYSPLGLHQEDAKLTNVSYPLVLVGENIFNGPKDHVTMKNIEAAQAATEYLIGLGHKRIAVIGAHKGEVIGSAGLRLTGYKKALKAAGIKYDESLVGYTAPWFRSNGAEVMAGLLKRTRDFTAVFALNDLLAFGAMRVLQEQGISIPKDVSVLGFDNLEEAKYSIPSLSSLEPGKEEIARKAVDALIERMSSGDSAKGPAREIEVDFQIVERESTAPVTVTKS
jgi:DNA-binding LacI/PurR family transcriptional regulator